LQGYGIFPQGPVKISFYPFSLVRIPPLLRNARNPDSVCASFLAFFLRQRPVYRPEKPHFCGKNPEQTQTFNITLIIELGKHWSPIFMATIKDVAKRAGVSTTTVSHVINKTRFVAEETREAVWQAIKELHYSPSAVARSLKVNHTKTLGLLATSSEAPYFAEIIEAVENHCFDKGYTLILGNAHNDLQKQRAYLSMMAQKRVDGLLVMCSEYPDDLLQMLEENRNIPMVVMDWGESRADFTDTVLDNAFQGGYLAGRYLIERGHRDIGAIPGQMERNTGGGRHAGFLKALEEAGIQPRPEWIVQGDFEPESGYQAMQQILSQKQRPTAVFCGGDIMAMGAICAADEMGLRVPQDISIIGYDNVRNARYFAPALTTVHQPKAQLGEKALDMLLDRITSKREVSQTIEVHPTLIERRSVADGPFRDYRR